MNAALKHLYARASTGKGVNPHHAVILTILLGLVALMNSMFHGGIAHTLLYCVGTLHYFLIVFFKYRYSCSDSDYIPSGEGAAAIMTVVLANLLITDNIFLVLLLTVLVVTLINGLITAFSGDRIFSGLVINATILITLLYITHVHSGLPAGRLACILTGAAHLSAQVRAFALLCLMLAAVIISLVMLLEPEIALHSQGRSFFSISGIPSRYVRMLKTIAWGTALAATVLCAGLMAGTGLYIYYAMKDRASILEIFLILLLYTQALVLLAALAGPVSAVCVSLAASYAAHAAHIIKGSTSHA